MESLLSNSPYPPKFSIANGNFIGELPKNFNLTEAEMAMIGITANIMQVKSVRGGIGQKLCGHTTVFIVHQIRQLIYCQLKNQCSKCFLLDPKLSNKKFV